MAASYVVPRKFVVVGYHVETRSPIIEEHEMDGLIKHFVGDPRFCPAKTSHRPHNHIATYRNRTGGLLRVTLGCNGDSVTPLTPVPGIAWDRWHAGTLR